MPDLPNWLLIIPILGFLIFVHELGHFVTAKRFGIKVTEFAFGFPPRIFGYQRGETLYSLNLIPIGGFVRMVGEDDPSHPRSFAAQSVFRRIVVLVAGSFMNIMVPVVVFTILFLIPQDTVVGDAMITGVGDGSPAQEAGLRAGDIIIQVDGEPVDNHYELAQKIMVRLGDNTELLVRRAPLVFGLGSSAETMVIEPVTVVPRLDPPELIVVNTVNDPEREISLADARALYREYQVGDTVRQGPVGIMIATANRRVVKRSYPIWEAVPRAVGRIWEVIDVTKDGISQWFSGGPDPGFAGPVGIARVTGEVAKIGISPVFELMALISISLAVFNILPIPALDGGRLLFVVIEWARGGKRISPQKEGLVHFVGLVVIIGFIIIISYIDISNLLGGESVLP